MRRCASNPSPPRCAPARDTPRSPPATRTARTRPRATRRAPTPPTPVRSADSPSGRGPAPAGEWARLRARRARASATLESPSMQPARAPPLPRARAPRESVPVARRPRGAGVGRQPRMAGREDQAEQIVADLIVDRLDQVGLGTDLALLQLAAEVLVFGVLHLAAAQVIDRAMLGGRHEPGPRIIRHA